MSSTSGPFISTSERVAGKWQIPALIISAILLLAAILSIESPDRRVSIDEHLLHLDRLIRTGLYDPAQNLAGRLMDWKDLDQAARGELHLQLARAASGRAERLEDTSRATSSAVINEYEKALYYGRSLAVGDRRRFARCFESLGQYDLAMKQLRLAAELSGPPALEDRRRIIEVSAYPSRVPADEYGALLEAFISDAHDSPGDLMWGLDRRVEWLISSRRTEEASHLLEAYRERFVGSPYQPDYEYLLAESLADAGRFEESERLLRELLNDTLTSNAVYAKAGWLLGRVVMNDGSAQRPEEAVSIFRQVISSRSDRVYLTASRVGMAEALAELYRFDDSVQSYRAAIDELADIGGHRLVNPEMIRTSLTVVAERARQDGRTSVALDFMRLAVLLTDPEDVAASTKYLTMLGDLQAAVAREKRAEAEGGGEQEQASKCAALMADARLLFDEAGGNYVRVSRINTLDEDRSAAAMWTAASLFDEGGNHDRTIELLQAFVRDRPDAQIIPRVLLRLGQSLQTLGRYREAIATYQRDISSHPRSPHANEALIPLAECFMALGAEHEEEAENALKQITEDSLIFTPDAAKYRDAMFLLGDLYSRQGRFEEAIVVFDEVLENYPDDPRIARALFLTANGYRQSAMALKPEIALPEFVGESKRLQAEYTHRLEEAGRRFRALTEHLERCEGTSLSEAERLYLQDARLYEAACTFELGRYAEALALYERAAWIGKDSPAALGAYVQVINCYIFLGREDEAESALRRAQYLVETISDERFEGAGRFESREGWRRYFDWVAETLVKG